MNSQRIFCVLLLLLSSQWNQHKRCSGRGSVVAVLDPAQQNAELFTLLKTGQEVLCMLEEMLRTLQDQACEQQMHHRNSSSEELEWGTWCKSTSRMRGCVLFICQKMWILRGRTQNNEALLLSSIILLYFTELYPDCLFGFVCVGSYFPMLAFKFHLEDIWAPSLNLNIQMLLLSHFILPVDKCNLFTCSRSACMLIKHTKRNPM